MKKIIYIGGFELPNKNAAAQRVIGNSYALKELGYEIIFLGISKKEKNLDNFKQFDDFKYYEKLYPQNSIQWLSYLTSVKDTIKIIKKHKKIDILICYNYPAIALWRLKNYCKKNNIKIIADVTEWYQGEGNIIHRCLKNLDTFLRMKIIHFKLDGVIAISRFLENFYKKEINTIYIPPLVNKNENKWKSEMNISNKEDNTILCLTYAGSPGKNKDKINKILRFLYESNFDSFQLNLIGFTKDDFLKEYPQEKSIVNNISSKIIFWGRISHLEVLKILKKSDFSIFFREVNRVTMAGFPTKFSESISCGVPVITTKTSDLCNYLQEGINGFWLEEDVEESISKIFKTKNIQELKEMKKNVDTKIFDFKNYIKEFKKIF